MQKFAIGLQLSSAAIGFFAAVLWYKSARVSWEPIPDQALVADGEEPLVQLDLPKQSRLSANAAIVTGISILLQAASTVAQAFQ